MQWVTTSLILKQLLGDEPDTWEVFVARFRQPVVAFARDQGLPTEEAEDAAQETLAAFLRAYREGRYDRDKGRLHSWLFGIAHRVVLNRRQKLARDRQRQPIAARTAFWEAVPADDDARRSWDDSWREAMFDQCLQQVRTELEPKTMLAFEAYALNGRPASDVARELEMSRNAVFLAKHRVLTRIRELRDQLETVV
ncbi:MAG: sigma-70 family RNA polymerase sigma factor [Planctomycetota bacterium]|nr:sigma-70 family RNA polymerase sigma factor [Planctomycetota bacterium]